MSITVEERARRLRLPAVLSYAFRPLFLAAGSWAIVGIAVWLAMFLGYVRLPTRFDPLTWHIHEMLFGFVMAAVGGFLPTAIPNWTNRLPVRGYPQRNGPGDGLIDGGKRRPRTRSASHKSPQLAFNSEDPQPRCRPR